MTSDELVQRFGPRDSMQYDVVIVGAGPAGLATAIRLKQINPTRSVAVLEKGAEPGAHILSGAVMDPRGLSELFPTWKEMGAPLNQPATRDDFLILSEFGQRRVPTWLTPRNFHNDGCFIISLSNLVKWMAQQAESLGVEIFPGFAAAEVLYDERGSVRGVATGNMGLGKDGTPTSQFQLGMELLGKYTIFAEGARGHLGKQLIERFGLAEGKDPQTFAIGIKELWEVDPGQSQPGLVVHTAGWPIEDNTFGGGFLYHLEHNRVALGYVIGLGYENPYMSPFDEMQRWKAHPSIRAHIEGGRRIGYGARAINNGTPQALPKSVFPGGALVGCDAGYLNAARIKGSHTAIKSGMLCAEAIEEALNDGREADELLTYPAAFEKSWLLSELNQTRNFKNWFGKGKYIGQFMVGIEQWLLPKIGVGAPPWTVRNHQYDHQKLKPASACRPIAYPKADGRLTFDRLSSVFLSNTNHEENQPAHLTLKDSTVPTAVNLLKFAGPESRYCPAGVYEFVPSEGNGGERLQINAQNCVHCKTCDIKDPTQNIVWVPPEGGGGPSYVGM